MNRETAPAMNTTAFRIAALAFLSLSTPLLAQSGPAFDRASAIRFPQVDLAGASIEDAATYLSRTSRELTQDKAGLNIIVKTAQPVEKRVSLRVTNMPAPDAVRYCAESAGLFVTWSGNAAIITDRKDLPATAVALDGGGRTLHARASKVVVPQVDFKDATLREVLEFISAKSASLSGDGWRLNVILDSPTPARLEAQAKAAAPAPTGVVIAGLDEPAAPKAPEPPATPLAEQRISFTLKNTSVAELLRLTALVSGAGVRWDSAAVIVGPPGVTTRPAVTNTVSVKGRVLMERLAAIEIPKVEFRDMRLGEAVTFLSRKITELDPERKSVNLLANGTAADEELTLRADRIPALEALRYVAELSGTELRLEHSAIIFQPRK